MLVRWLLGNIWPELNEGNNNNNNNNKTPTMAPASAPATVTPPPPPPPPTTTTTLTSSSSSSSSPSTNPPHPDLLSKRSLRQLGLMLGGAGFFYWSVMVSRRAALRHQAAAQLKFFQGNHFMWRSQKELPKREPLVAVEALNLATLNVLSFGIMAAGGVSWAFNISSLEDLRRLTRRSIERSVVKAGTADEEAEREVVEWFGRTFGVGGGAAEVAAGGERGEGEGEEKKGENAEKEG